MERGCAPTSHHPEPAPLPKPDSHNLLGGHQKRSHMVPSPMWPSILQPDARLSPDSLGDMLNPKHKASA